jgi:hypothetical protein
MDDVRDMEKGLERARATMYTAMNQYSDIEKKLGAVRKSVSQALELEDNASAPSEPAQHNAESVEPEPTAAAESVEPEPTRSNLIILDAPPAPHAPPGATRSTSLVDFKLNLGQVLDMFGRTDVGSHMTPGDGNCFFTGAAQCGLLLEIFELEKREPTDADIRGIEREAKKRGAEYRQRISELIIESDWIKQYISHYWKEMTSLTLSKRTSDKAKAVAQQLGTPGTWANELAIRALALVLKKDIFTVNVTGEVVHSVYHYIINDEPEIREVGMTLFHSIYKKHGFDLPHSMCFPDSIVLVHSDHHFWATYPRIQQKSLYDEFATICKSFGLDDCFEGVSMDKLKELFQWN